MKNFVWLFVFIATCAWSKDGSPPPDLNYTSPVPVIYGPTNSQTSGKTLRANQTVNPAVRNLVIISAGQSNQADVVPTAYTPANPAALDDLNIVDGAIYAAADPLLGATVENIGGVNLGPGNFVLRLADNLVTANKFDRVIIASIAVGGTLAADWQSGFASNRISAILHRLSFKGITAGTNVTIIVVWGDGESDCQVGTSQASYTASLNAVIAASVTAGFTGTWFVAEQTYQNGTTCAGIQAGQAAVINHGSNIWAGPNADALVGNVCVGSTNCRQADNIHWSDTGSASYASAWQTALGLFGAPF